MMRADSVVTGGGDNIINKYIYMDCEGSGFNYWGFRADALVLFFIYVNTSLVLLALTIPAPWVLLRVGWTFSWFHPG